MVKHSLYISLRKGLGIDDLLEAVLMQAELLELTAPAEGMAAGVVLNRVLIKAVVQLRQS